MSYRQFGKRMGMTASSAAELAMREEEGTITLNVLRKAADALNMELVHIFIQKSTASNSAERTLDGLIDEQARKVATGIVISSATTMNLEDQGTDQSALEEAIDELATKLKLEMPRTLWN